MKLIFSLLVVSIFSAHVLNAQSGVCELNCVSNACGGAALTVNTFQHDYQDGEFFYTSFELNGGCYIRSDVYSSSMGNFYNSVNLPFKNQHHSGACVPFNTLQQVRFVVAENVNENDVDEKQILSVKIYNEFGVEIPTTNQSGLYWSEDDGIISAYVSAALLPNKRYTVVADFRYDSDPSSLFTTWHNESSSLSICVGGVGDANSNSTYIPDLTPSTDCNSANIHIDNFDSRLTYYWKKSSDADFVYDQAHRFNNSGNATVTENATYQVVGYFDASGSADYTSPVGSVNVIIPTQPSMPVFDGGGYLCSCNPATNFSVGANADNLQWYAYTVTNNDTIKQNIDPDQLFYFSQLVNYKIGVASLNNNYGCVSPMITVNAQIQECDACQNKFSLVPGKTYVASAWMSDGNYPFLTEKGTQMEAAMIKITFTNLKSSQTQSFQFQAKGNIVEDWQRMEETFVVPLWAENMEIEFLSTKPNESAFFDDFRIHPFNSSMVSYVYNQDNMQLEAQLDENNFYTRYIYDEEGNLVKTNVETIEGVRTAAETRSNIKR